MSAATAGSSITLSTAVTVLYDPAVTTGATKVRVMARASNTAVALVNVAGLHAAGVYMGLGPGHWAEFGSHGGPVVGQVTATTTSGSSPVIDFGIVSRG